MRLIWKLIFLAAVALPLLTSPRINLQAQATEATPHTQGVLSNNGKYFAYVISRNEGITTEPYIYIKDTSTGKAEQVPFDPGYNFVPLNWSPKDNYLVLLKLSHSLGDLETFVYEYKQKKIIENFTVLSDKILWDSESTMLYAFPYINCKRDCTIGSELSSFDVQTKQHKSLHLQKSKNNRHFPEIDSLSRSQDKIKVVYKTRNQENEFTWKEDFDTETVHFSTFDKSAKGGIAYE